MMITKNVNVNSLIEFVYAHPGMLTHKENLCMSTHKYNLYHKLIIQSSIFPYSYFQAYLSYEFETLPY